MRTYDGQTHDGQTHDGQTYDGQTYDGQVEVRRGDGRRPEQFLWRGRLWHVREVLTARSDGRHDREVWRVRAARGRWATTASDPDADPGLGVFDLFFDWTTGDWCLAGVDR